MYKVLITTSGTGSRLREITQHTNKALIEVGGKPVLARILERYDPAIPIVITLGYRSDQITQYIAANWSDRIVEYATVDKYEGSRTSCGYSMLQAEKFLQCPFIFHACDTIVFEPIPAPDTNWTAGYVNSHIPADVVEKNFTTHLMKNDKLVQVNPLGAKDYTYLHMGLTAVNDFEAYWRLLRKMYNEDPNDGKLTDIDVINAMIDQGLDYQVHPFSVWLDTGNSDTLAYTQQYFQTLNNLD